MYMYITIMHSIKYMYNVYTYMYMYATYMQHAVSDLQSGG